MAGSCKDYRSWHLQNLKDHSEAAYYLMAALEDSLEMNLPMHFLKAIASVRRANGAVGNPLIYMTNYIKPEDSAALNKLMVQLAGVMVEKAEKEFPMELQYS